MQAKKFVKPLLMTAMVIMLVVATVFATMAYMTSTAKVTNLFTVGNVTLKMDETDVDIYGVKDGETRVTTNSYRLVPGKTYTKDPIITVTANSEESYLFVTVANPLIGYEADTTEQPTMETQMLANGWKVHQEATATTPTVYVYVGAGAGADADAMKVGGVATDTAIKVFDNFTLKSDLTATQMEALNNTEVELNAYAIQAQLDTEGKTAAEVAWTALQTHLNG